MLNQPKVNAKHMLIIKNSLKNISHPLVHPIKIYNIEGNKLKQKRVKKNIFSFLKSKIKLLAMHLDPDISVFSRALIITVKPTTNHRSQ